MATDWKILLGEAHQLFEEARTLVSQEDEMTGEDNERLEKLLEAAREKKGRAMQLKSIIEEAKESVAQKEQENLEKEIKDKPAPGLFKNWGEYLEAIWYQSVEGIKDPRLTKYREDRKEGHQTKDLTGAVGSSGGFLIPTQFLPQLQAMQAEDTIIRGAGATVIRMTSRSVQLPVLDQTGTTAGFPHWYGGMRFYWTEEGAEKTETEPEFKLVTLVAKKLTGITNASDELVEDSAISLADFLTGPMGFAGGVAWMEDYAFIRGVGGGQPLGILNSPCLLTPARAAAGAIGYVDVINMLEQFLPSGKGQWVVTQSGMSNLIQMAGPAGNPSYVWQPNARDGVPGFLLGMPVRFSEKVPVIGTTGDILLMDPRYYLIGDRQRTTIESTKFHKWAFDKTSWRVVHRVDGQPWLSAPITYEDGATQISPFVALGSTAGS